MSCWAGRAHLKPRHIQGRGEGGQPPPEVQEAFPEFSFLLWEPLAGWGGGRWQCWGGGAALGAALELHCTACSGTQGWAAGESPCRCCWSTGTALQAQDKGRLLQIAKGKS